MFTIRSTFQLISLPFFDSLTGTFTFTGYPTNAAQTQTRLVLKPDEVFQSASLFVPAGTSITLRDDGLTWAGLREMNFPIVPEPSSAGLLALGAWCCIRLRKGRARSTENKIIQSGGAVGGFQRRGQRFPPQTP